MIDLQIEHPLRGVRLGKMERWLLRHASSPEAIRGLALAEAQDRRTRETLRRGALKLEKLDLLERHRVTLYVRAADPRAEGLVFRDGKFWRREDPTRAHAVRRTVVWLSPFGQQIVWKYGHQLSSGAPIRWDARTVLRAQEVAGWVNRDARLDYLSGWEENERDSVVLAEPLEAGAAARDPGGGRVKR